MKLAVVFLILLGSSAAGILMASAEPPQSQPAAEPEHIQVQHILISFAGKLPGKNVTRTQDEAKTLASDLLARARKGEDFGALVKQHTDDAAPGIYGMANLGVAPAGGEYARTGMVAAFGDVGFKLKLGEIGMAEFDARKSPYGYHIIKRIK